MKRHQAIDLAERLWGEDCIVRYQHYRRDGKKCRVGRFDGEEFVWFGTGNTWEQAFSQALSDNPLNERDTLMEAMFP